MGGAREGQLIDPTVARGWFGHWHVSFLSRSLSDRHVVRGREPME